VSGVGWWRLTLAALALGGFAHFLKDFLGFRYRLVGGYVWAAAFLLTLTIGLFYFAQALLPLPWSERWLEGLRQVLSFNFGGPALRLKTRPRRTTMGTKEPRPGQGPATSFVRHRAGMVQSHNALVIKRGPAFERVAGPGYVSLRRSERVDQVVDLRRHARSHRVEALTKDGIPLVTEVTVWFRVRQPDEPEDAALPYPYESSAVFHLDYMSSLNTDEGTLLWSEHVGRRAVAELVEELSQHTLDQFQGSDGAGAQPVEAIEHRLRRQLTAEFGRMGVAVLNISVGQFRLPDEIIEQRIANWQSSWQDRMLAERASGDAKAMRRLKLAQARAQIEIIESITQGIEALRQRGDLDLEEVVALRVVEALRDGVTDQVVRPLIPEQTMSLIQGLLNEGDTST
jgi:regulator of protease activity HflC (stomatin/prohibitin superfamily)